MTCESTPLSNDLANNEALSTSEVLPIPRHRQTRKGQAV